MDDLQKQVDELKKEIQLLKARRLTQDMYIPSSVKNRHLGEPNSYIRSGLSANLPPGNIVTLGSIVYFETDTGRLKIWDGTKYVYITLN